MDRFTSCFLFVFSVFFLSTSPLPASTHPLSENWSEYITEHALPLDGIRDAHRLLPYLAPYELVLMGETTHGTQDYYAWRAELSKALISEAGFRFIAVEGDWHTIDRLDRYVRHFEKDSVSARNVLKTFDRWPEWMWANPVIEELAEWLHAYNAERSRETRVGLHGIDVYGWGSSAEKLPSYLEQLEPGWGSRAEKGLAPLRRLRGNNDAYYQAVMRGESTGMPKLQKIHRELTSLEQEKRDACPETWLQSLQHTSLLLQAKRHLSKSAQGHPRSWNPRAENFMQTVERLRSYYGASARGIVWAHNTHIGDARYTPMRDLGLITIGQRARETLGEDRVFLLGFASDSGTFRAGVRWGAPGSIMPLPSATLGTFDAWLRDNMPPYGFLPMAAARLQAPLMEPLGHRGIGVVHDTGSHMQHNYVPSVIPRRYDGILYIQKTQALDELT